MSAPPSSPTEDPEGVLDSIFKSNIGRIVAFIATPLLAVAVPPIVDGLNTVLDTDFSNQEISNIAIATIVGIAIVIWQWLRNRGNWETRVAELYHSLHLDLDQAQQILNPPPAPAANEVAAAEVAQELKTEPPYDQAAEQGPASSALGMRDPEE